MNKITLLITVFLVFIANFSKAQEGPDSLIVTNELLDSLYIAEVENVKGIDKVLHAEPLFIDLIRDLGARKGEKEWNVGMGLIDNQNYDSYSTLVEYEWAPIDRLGLEVELPFTFHYRTNGNGTPPKSKMNSVKLAAQYTFLVSEKRSTSLALGYIHEFEMTHFSAYTKEPLFTGQVYNPFFVAAKRWGDRLHTLVYAGPVFMQHFNGGFTMPDWQVNSNLHYMIPGTRNFIGVEFNKSFYGNDFDMTIRPQVRVGLAENLLLGIVTGIPIDREDQRFSSFIRVIYEPGHRIRH